MHPVTPAGMLAGRANELALLDGYLRDLARGGGNAVLIEGEPGIGKTTLVRTALASPPPGSCQVFWGAGGLSCVFISGAPTKPQPMKAVTAKRCSIALKSRSCPMGQRVGPARRA